MIYATVEEYRELCNDFELNDDEVNTNLYLASAKAEELTFGRLREMNEKESLTPFQSECVKNFVCFQAKYYKENGIENNNDISSYTVGSISVSVDSKKTEADALCVSPVALSFLDRSGLRWRGV